MLLEQQVVSAPNLFRREAEYFGDALDSLMVGVLHVTPNHGRRHLVQGSGFSAVVCQISLGPCHICSVIDHRIGSIPS